MRENLSYFDIPQWTRCNARYVYDTIFLIIFTITLIQRLHKLSTDFSMSQYPIRTNTRTHGPESHKERRDNPIRTNHHHFVFTLASRLNPPNTSREITWHASNVLSVSPLLTVSSLWASTEHKVAEGGRIVISRLLDQTLERWDKGDSHGNCTDIVQLLYCHWSVIRSNSQELLQNYTFHCTLLVQFCCNFQFTHPFLEYRYEMASWQLNAIKVNDVSP